jgi:hypothetical protein
MAPVYGADNRVEPAVAVDDIGNFVVVWHTANVDFYDDIFARTYSSAGVPQGSAFRVNTYTTYGQWFPAVATGADGDFVVVWENGIQYAIAGRRLQEDGDGVFGAADNCASETNPDLLDSDLDGAGDMCDPCPLLLVNSCDPNRSGATFVGPVGDVFTTPDGSITIDVPTSALSTGRSISVTESVDGFVLDPDGSFLPLYRIGAAPVGQQFNVPVTLTFRWEDRDNDGRVDRGTCLLGGLSCDENTDCSASTCSITSNPTEGNLLLKRNALRFSKNGFGATVTEAKCSSHQAGGGCQLAAADCADPAGTGQATVANCCDTVNNEWVFQTCDFSEFSIGDMETIVLPVLSSVGWAVMTGLLAFGLWIPGRWRGRRPLG